VEPIVAVWVRAPVASLTHGDAGRHRTGARSRPTRRAAGSPRRGRKPRGSAGRVPAPAAPEHKSRGPGGHRPPPSSTPRNRNEPVQMVETTLSYTQSTFSLRTWIHVRGSPCPGTSGNLCRSTPDGGNHVELCDRHVEIRGPKGIRINWGSRRFMGRPLKPPVGAFPKGDPFPHSSSAASPAG